MTQVELAGRSGLTAERLSRLVSGNTGARVETMQRLASTVGLRFALVPDDFAADFPAGRLLDESGER